MFEKCLFLFLYLVLSCLCFLSQSAPAVAQQKLDNNHEKIIKEGLDRIQNKLEPLLKKQDVFLQPGLITDKQPQTFDNEPNCFDITQIVMKE